MNDQIDINKMGIESCSLLSNIHKLCFDKMPEKTWKSKDFEELFSIDGTISYVMSKAGEPVGFILIRKIIDEAEIITFCILPKYCNNGYATLLLEWVIRKLQMHSIKRLFLEVRNNNLAAMKLYKKCSFEIIGQRNGYYKNRHNDKIDALVMQCQLIV